MRKVAIQFLAIIALFFGCWAALAQVDWISLLGVKQTTLKTEQKLGTMIWEMVKRSETVITEDSVTAPVDSILARICSSNAIDHSQITLHILKKDEVNAFALPGGHLVVYTGLIGACKNESELAGVLGHEIGHIRHGHVMRKLIKETGLAVLLGATSRNGSTETAARMLRLLSSSAYDRSLETEADLASADYLINAQLDPRSISALFYRLASAESDAESRLSWISNHPDSRARAERIKAYLKGKKVEAKPVLSKGSWERLKAGSGN